MLQKEKENIIRNKYPDYIRQMDMAEILGVTEKTACNIRKKNSLETMEIREGLLRYYCIPLEQVIDIWRARDLRNSDDYIDLSIQILSEMIKDEKDLLDIQDSSRITGFFHFSIERMIKNGVLETIRVKRRVYIPKIRLIEYMASSKYRNSRSNTNLQNKLLDALKASQAV